jgi:hypothetical protein
MNTNIEVTIRDDVLTKKDYHKLFMAFRDTACRMFCDADCHSQSIEYKNYRLQVMIAQMQTGQSWYVGHVYYGGKLIVQYSWDYNAVECFLVEQDEQ